MQGSKGYFTKRALKRFLGRCLDGSEAWGASKPELSWDLSHVITPSAGNELNGTHSLVLTLFLYCVWFHDVV